MMLIGVQIRFLVTPQLTDPASPNRAEWPPAPDRIFQALVATAAETQQDISVLSVLETAPAIQASKARTPFAPKQYVKENFRRSSKSFNGYHQGAKRYLPTAHPSSPTVTYLWEDVPEDVVPQIAQIVEQVTHIGRAASLVSAQLIEHYSEKPTLTPNANGEMRLRAPYPGRLAHLQEDFNAGRRSRNAHEVSYQDSSDKLPSSQWGELMVLRPSLQLDCTRAAHWTSELRKAVMSVAAEPIPSFIHGHDNHQHVAWTAIPDVGHHYASGGVLGLGCWVPKSLDESQRGLIGAYLMRVNGLGAISLQLDENDLKGLRRETWSRRSTQWASVTPIALDRWPKKDKPPASIIADSIQMLGYPRPTHVECSKVSRFKAAPYSNRYQARKQNRYITHAEIHFEQAIAGPLLLGADRFFGGGLCRPLEDRS